MTQNLQLVSEPLRKLPSAKPPLAAVPQDRARMLEKAKAYIATLPRGGPPKDPNWYVSDYAHEIIY